jgi:dTDP-4-amino-4,6-dideoxygalactose transaminase
VQHCVATSSGTASIHVALGALGLRPGDEVITSPITDFGTVIGILYQNAIPIFADLDPHTYNMSPASVERCITPKTRALLVVHLAGNPADMHAIMKIARRRRLPVIEDCAQSWLASHRGRFVGTIGDIGCFSLNDFKHISSGDGGMVVTDDDELARKMAMFADKNYRRTPGGDALREIASLAPNYRMTELQGAVALAQLRKLKRIVRRRHEIGEAYTKGLTGIPGIFPHKVTPGARCTYWFYMFRIDPEVLGVSRNKFTEAVAAEGIAASPGYIPTPVYRWEIFRKRSVYPGSLCPYDCKHARKGIRYPQGLCPEAECILKTAVRLPVNEFFTATDVRETVGGIRKVAAHYLARKGITFR